jgi:hypothetical protein
MRPVAAVVAARWLWPNALLRQRQILILLCPVSYADFAGIHSHFGTKIEHSKSREGMQSSAKKGATILKNSTTYGES